MSIRYRSTVEVAFRLDVIEGGDLHCYGRTAPLCVADQGRVADHMNGSRAWAELYRRDCRDASVRLGRPEWSVLPWGAAACRFDVEADDTGDRGALAAARAVMDAVELVDAQLTGASGYGHLLLPGGPRRAVRVRGCLNTGVPEMLTALRQHRRQRGRMSVECIDCVDCAKQHDFVRLWMLDTPRHEGLMASLVVPTGDARQK